MRFERNFGLTSCRTLNQPTLRKFTIGPTFDPAITSITVIESVDGSPIVCAYLHEGGMASRVGSRARRFLCTGHENGTTQIWDLTTALEQHRSASAAARG
jgi:hypothetical protein